MMASRKSMPVALAWKLASSTVSLAALWWQLSPYPPQGKLHLHKEYLNSLTCCKTTYHHLNSNECRVNRLVLDNMLFTTLMTTVENVYCNFNSISLSIFDNFKILQWYELLLFVYIIKTICNFVIWDTTGD